MWVMVSVCKWGIMWHVWACRCIMYTKNCCSSKLPSQCSLSFPYWFSVLCITHMRPLTPAMFNDDTEVLTRYKSLVYAQHIHRHSKNNPKKEDSDKVAISWNQWLVVGHSASRLAIWQILWIPAKLMVHCASDLALFHPLWVTRERQNSPCPYKASSALTFLMATDWAIYFSLRNGKEDLAVLLFLCHWSLPTLYTVTATY